MSVSTISNGQLTLSVSTHGAEMQSVKDAQGRERLWQGDPAFWTGRAPIMFPVCGGFKDDLYYLDGKAYPMTKHGFAKLKEWTVTEQKQDEISLLLNESTEGFPFRYEFVITYKLTGISVEITMKVKNLDEQHFYFGIGSHEAYATPGGIEDYKVIFEQEEKLEVNELVGNLIKPEPVLLADHARELPLEYRYFAVDALVFRSLKSRKVMLINSAGDRKVTVEYPGMDVFMLWTKPNAGYICLEPWSNAPDFLDTDQQIEHKPGCVCLDPGEEFTRTHTITFE